MGRAGDALNAVARGIPALRNARVIYKLWQDIGVDTADSGLCLQETGPTGLEVTSLAARCNTAAPKRITLQHPNGLLHQSNTQQPSLLLQFPAHSDQVEAFSVCRNVELLPFRLAFSASQSVAKSECYCFGMVQYDYSHLQTCKRQCSCALGLGARVTHPFHPAQMSRVSCRLAGCYCEALADLPRSSVHGKNADLCRDSKPLCCRHDPVCPGSHSGSADYALTLYAGYAPHALSQLCVGFDIKHRRDRWPVHG